MKIEDIMAMPDSNKKLSLLNRERLKFGIFNKDPLGREANRLMDAGFKDLALIYAERKNKK